MKPTRTTLFVNGCCVAAALAATAAGAKLPANAWLKVADNQTGQRTGAVLLHVPELKQMLLFGGSAKGAPYVQAFDPGERSWSPFTPATPQARRGIHPYYQAACDPKAKTLYCLHEGALYTFDLKTKKWTSHGRPAALEGLSWHTMAIDAGGRKLVVVGSDKGLDNLGWTRTAILDLDSGKWSTLPLPKKEAIREHKELVAAREALIDLVGHTRLAWYRDPKGVGTAPELTQLAERCAAFRKMPAMARSAAEIDGIAGLLSRKKTLAALKATRALQRELEVVAEKQYPVPPSRRNSPLVFDPKNRLFVLFGGDHEDYQMNDTWVLDLAKQAWRRAQPGLAPSPRAGHALLWLPRSGKILLYEGYIASSNPDYRSRPWSAVEPRQMWVYDAAADRWDLVGAWKPKRGNASLPRAAGAFHGYSAQWFSPPALAADEHGRIVLVVPADRRNRSSTWMMELDLARLDAAGREKLATAPGQRLYRKGRFLAACCEVPDPPKDTALDKLPPNRWVKLPDAPRNVAHGCRQRDWGTAVWDSANDQVLMWGGGHCVRSASTVLHYSPVSGRMAEGYDADEPYGYNGGGGFGSSLWNRPWVPTHGYNLYAYDPRCKLLVTATGFLYDPARMDWLRTGPMERPFRFQWGHTVLETTPHGVVAWAQAANGERVGLWLFDRDKGWQDLKPQGKLWRPYCDSDGIVYDSKRDRLLIGWGGGYAKKGDGSITTFDFKTRKLGKLLPANIALGKLRNTREMVYLDHADCVLFGSTPHIQGDPKTGKRTTVVYDCAKNRYLLLDAGDVPYGHSTGWMVDPNRKLVYVFTYRGAAYALRLDPQTATLLEKPPMQE